MAEQRPPPEAERASGSVVLGPEAIAAVGAAVDALVTALSISPFRVRQDGRLRFFDEGEGEGALLQLGVILDQQIPDDLRLQIVRHSGLGWPTFCEHVVGYWYPQRARMGFLRALEDRAALHGVKVRLHWNSGRVIRPERRHPGPGVIAVGAGIGAVAGLFLTRYQRWNTLLGLLAVGVGIVAARIYQRVAVLRICGDRLCRARMGRGDTCPGCGADLP